MSVQNNLLKSGLVPVIFWALLLPTQIARAYEPSAHRLIIGRAIRLYNDYGSSNEPDLYTQIIANGADNEDDWTDDHVFCYTIMHVTIPHFWNADGGIDDLVDMAGDTWPNAWMKASGYRVKEFGLLPCRGNREGLWPQAVWYYRTGQKDVAYELLGHIAHLIADMSVPAHVHEHEHIVEDRYEELVSDNMWWLLEALDPEQLDLGLITIPRAPDLSSCGLLSNFPLFYLMYTTNQHADFFASVHDNCVGPAFCPGSEVWGDVFDVSGWVNYSEYPTQMWYYQDPDHIDTPLWVCNNCGKLLCIGGDQCWPCIYCLSYNVAAVNPVYLIAERCTLVYAVRATATLFELFVNATETTPPTTTLHISDPKYHDGNDWHITPYTQLTLTATDDKSGVNCTIYRISGNAYNSGWFIYTGPFDLSKGPDGTALNEGRYAIYFTSIDRAGNVEDEEKEEVIVGYVYNTARNQYYTSIQAAIDDSVNGDEILAGPTTYNEAIDFKGKAVRLYSSGGPEVTIIDGSGIAGVYHVIQCVNGEDANTILEGFTITGGNANGPSYPDRDGGGMYNVNSSPTITNCIFTGNNANHGGGMLNIDCAPTVTGCTFENNIASGGALGGGGMYNHNSSPVVTDCIFIGNSGEPIGGGGMYNHYSSPTVTNCTFRVNTASKNGGGMCNSPETSGPKLLNCKFIDNTASQYGGGIYNRACYNLSTLTNCTFSANTAHSGGAIFNDWYSSPIATDCNFTGNTASNDGGGVFNSVSSPKVVNCSFRGNTATANGGGMYNNVSNPTVTNCTFNNNTALAGGGMLNWSNSNPTVINCILWGDTPDEVNDVNSSTTINYSDVEGGTGQSWFGTGCIDTDPCFVDAGGGDFRLSVTSPCIDAGDNGASNLPDIDMDGHSRIIDGDCDGSAVVDMGVYEFNYAYMGDLDYNCRVDFFDFSIFGRAWMAEEGEPGWDWACDISDPPDDYIDWRDVTKLCDNWLAQIP